MKLRVIAAAALGAAGMIAIALPASAGQRWQFGVYAPFPPNVFFGGLWGPPPPPPRAYAPPAYYQGEPEFYYEVAPGQYVPVYGNDGEFLPPDERDASLFTDEPQQKKAQPPRRGLAYVPVPRPKPTAPLRAEDEIPEEDVIETPQEDKVEAPKPAQKLSGPAISCAKAREIVGDFGFTDIETVACSGREYGFRARRDGKSFEVRLSSLTGELIEVKRR
jgi:hypothetical protein